MAPCNNADGMIDLDKALDVYGAQARAIHRPARAQAIAYTAAAGAALALAPSADAGIVHSGPINATFSNTTGTFAVNLDGDANIDFVFTFNFTSTTTRYVTLQPQGGNALVSNAGGALRLASGAPINAGLTFTGATGALRTGQISSSLFLLGDGSWPGGTMSQGAAGFVGVQFNIGGNTHYGWIRVGISNSTDIPGAPVAVTFYDWAYEDFPNGEIIAGAVIPEPSPAAGLALLAAGATGVAAWRRRKKPAA